MTQKNEFPWINSEVNVFDMTIGTPLYVPNLAIPQIIWLKDDPRKGTKVVVTLFEMMTDSCFLLGLTESSNLMFDITRKVEGLRTVYNPDLVIASLTDCEILNKTIEDLAILHPDLIGVVGIKMQMRAKLVIKA